MYRNCSIFPLLLQPIAARGIRPALLLGGLGLSKMPARDRLSLNLYTKGLPSFYFTFILLIYALAKTLHCNSGYSRHSGNYYNGIFCH